MLLKVIDNFTKEFHVPVEWGWINKSYELMMIKIN